MQLNLQQRPYFLMNLTCTPTLQLGTASTAAEPTGNPLTDENGNPLTDENGNPLTD
jgi:hypothetical protein